MNYIPKIIYGSTTLQLSKPPLNDPFNEDDKTSNTVAVSEAGSIQTAHLFFEENRSVTLTFLSQAETDSLRTFWNTWGGLGKEFKYFESSDESTYSVYTLSQTSFAPKRLVSDGAGGFICEVNLAMRRPY